MNRQTLWDLMKKENITHSTRADCPPDKDLKVVIGLTTAHPKKLIDFICSLDGASNG